MDDKDNEALARYLGGDVDALEGLVEKYRRPLFGFILNMTGGAAEAEDVFQEVWLRVVRKAGGYRRGNFFGWIVRIARNLVIDRARRRKPEVSLDRENEDGASLGDVIPGPGPAPSDEAVAGDLGCRIADAVAGLPAEQKEVFVMRVQTGLSFKEIAAVQRVSINTALARMQYALAKMRTVLKDDYAELATARDTGGRA
jgi:RNA polymerase sigma-70 factor (ECF subfamily)